MPTTRTPAQITDRLQALGWAVSSAVAGYALADVLRRFQAAVPALLIDGDYGPATERELFAATAPVCAPGQLYPDFGVWLTYAESVKSQTAIRKGITNVPEPAHYRNMMAVYRRIYATVCDHYGAKLPVSSFYRSERLNKAIGGAATSAHVFGCAIDIDCDGLKHPTNKELFAWVVGNLLVDQVIAESPRPDGGHEWTHVGVNRYGQPDRKQVLIMRRVKGKATYEFA